MQVLLIEDEPGIGQFINQGLQEAGYNVDLVNDGKEGWEHASSFSYDLMIIDILLPHIDGLSLVKKIRDYQVLTPILLLTARDSVADRVKGLDYGADDYLAKPFAFSELLARLRALQRRPPLQVNTILQIADLTMDTVKREVRRNNKLIDLSPLEFKLLEYLLRHHGQVLTRTQILENVWDIDFYNDSNIIDVYIGYLRRKVDKNFSPALVHTVRGAGYCLRFEESQ
jgi:DNA-binding response OmpR family regulator